MYTKLSIILLWFILLFVSGCGIQGENAPVDNPKAKTALNTETNDADNLNDKTVIVYARGMDETEATAKMIEEYNKQSGKVYVIYQELPYETNRRYEQIISVFESNAADYDIVDANITWTAEFADKGYIQDINEFIKKDGFNTGVYMQSALDSSQYKDKIWGLPRNISAGVLFYRSDLVNGPPETWDALISGASDIKDNGNMKYGFVMAGKPSEELALEAMEFIYSYGGKIIDNTGTILINSNESIEGLNKMYEIYNADFVPDDMKDKSESDALVNFIDGESVFMRGRMSNWAIGNQQGSLVADKFNISRLPNGGAGASTTLTGTIMLINKNSPNKEAAWDFMKFAAGFEGQKINAVYASKFPTIINVLNDKDVIIKNPNFASKEFLDAIANTSPIPITPYYKELSDVMQEEVYAFLTSKQDAKKTVERIEAKMDSIINVSKNK